MKATGFALSRGFIGGIVLLCCSTLTAARGERWVDIWGSMPQLVEPHNLPPAPYNSGDAVFRNATLRQTVYITQSASTIRLQLSNVFGTTDLPIISAAVALPVTSSNSTGAGTSSIIPSTLKSVTFSGGSPSFTIPNGALAISDPISLAVKSQSVLTVTLYFGTSGQVGQSVTGHPGSRTTSFLAPGNQVSTPDLATVTRYGQTDHWYILSTIQGWLPPPSTALAIIGDSITDGRGSTTNNNNRWPDRLLARLQSSKSSLHRKISVINQAAGGNRILADGLGPNALGRIERDVLAHANTKYAIVYIGVNDIGTATPDPEILSTTGDRMISAYKQIITRLHGAGVAVFGATITPMSGPGQTYSDPLREKLRQRVNTWIRTGQDTPSAAESGKGGKGKGKGGSKFDAVIDFDALVRDAKNTTQLDPRYDVGDYLHLSPTGYEVMGAAVDLALFDKFRDGVEDSI
ncbi:SGNH hydrolase-type esterase domain containing protein [Rhypophila decipiens]